MGLQIVFSDNLDPSQPNLSVAFEGATAFLIEAPSLNAELEIDVYLQIYISGINGELVRNIPLGKIVEQAILLNITDTETISLIPAEYLDNQFQMKLLFLASSTTFLYAYIIKPDCTLCDLQSQNTAIQDRLSTIENTLDAIAAAVNVPVTSTVIAGTTTQQAFFFLQ